MSMSKPTLQNIIVPFEATKDYDFVFDYSGGDQVFQNNLVIYKTSDNSEVYNQIINPMFQLKHTILANKLVNGTEYKAQVKVANSKGEWSDFSNYCIFKCLSSPKIAITNVETGKVANSTYEFKGSYTQAEGELLKSYKFLLYDEHKNLLFASTEKFIDNIETFDGVLKYSFAGLQTNTFYNIQLKTITQNGIETNTDLIPFYCEFIAPKLASAISLENMPEEGAVKINCKVFQILGKSDGGTITYENDDWINLKDGMIYFDLDNGFKMENDFTLQLWCKDLDENSTFLKLYGTNGGTIELKLQEGKIRAYKTLGVITYYIFTKETINPTKDQTVYVFLQKKGDYLDLRTEIIS